MGHDRLRTTVDELHRLLDDIGDLDDDDRRELARALGDIQDHLDPSKPDAEPGTLSQTTAESYARFRERHPVLATGLQRLVDSLNQMGL